MTKSDSSWEDGWALDLPGETAEQILFAQVLKDLVHGSSFDVEFEEDGTQLAVDFTCGDELEEGICRLLIAAEVLGPKNPEMLGEFAEEALGDMADTAAEAAGAAELIAEATLEEIEIRAVPEDEERWDLVAPDWLAPDGAEVPFGFRSFKVATGDPWPSDAQLDRFSRVVLVPIPEGYRLYGVNLPEEIATAEE